MLEFVVDTHLDLDLSALEVKGSTAPLLIPPFAENCHQSTAEVAGQLTSLLLLVNPLAKVSLLAALHRLCKCFSSAVAKASVLCGCHQS